MQSVVIRRVLVQSLRNEGASVLVRTNLFRMRIGGSMAAAPDPPRRLQAGDDPPIIGGLYAAVAKDCPCGSATPLVFLQPWRMWCIGFRLRLGSGTPPRSRRSSSSVAAIA